jgi:hypothetical protein
MRAVTGTILSSQLCPSSKVPRILQRFVVESPSGILSSDAATYLRTAIEAAAELNDFRRDLRSLQQRDAVGGESERRRRPAPVDEGSKVEEQDGRWEPKVEEEDDYGMTAPAPVEKKSSKKKGSREDEEPRGEKRGVASPHQDLQATEKRRKKKEKSVKEEIETEYATEEQSRKALGDALQGMVSEEGIDSEKKAKKKKKKHIKQEEEEVMKEVEQKMLHAGVAENGLASEEKKRKKRKHTEEEEEVKKEVVDGDLGSEKKRKKKRGRDADNANDTELVENAKKKQRK